MNLQVKKLQLQLHKMVKTIDRTDSPVVNHKIIGDIEIIKVDQDTQNKLAGAKFVLEQKWCTKICFRTDRPTRTNCV